MSSLPAAYSKKGQTANPLPRAARLALLHTGVCFLLPAAAWLWFWLGFRFPPCLFNRLTGLYCLTCGATRAVSALLQGRFMHSFMLNPVPLLTAGFLLHTLIFEFVCWARASKSRFRWGLHWVVGIAGFALVFCILRNLGLAPAPV